MRRVGVIKRCRTYLFLFLAQGAQKRWNLEVSLGSSPTAHHEKHPKEDGGPGAPRRHPDDAYLLYRNPRSTFANSPGGGLVGQRCADHLLQDVGSMRRTMICTTYSVRPGLKHSAVTAQRVMDIPSGNETPRSSALIAAIGCAWAWALQPRIGLTASRVSIRPYK